MKTFLIFLRRCAPAGGVLCALALASCVTHVSMTKVTPGTNPRGLRVHLPAPFIVGRPGVDGNIAYEIVFLPDPDEEYALDAWTLLAKQNVVFNRTKEMFLAKAQINQDSTAVAKAFTDSADTLGTTAIGSLLQQQAAAAPKPAKNAAMDRAEDPQAQAQVKLDEDDLSQKQAALDTAKKDRQDADAGIANAANHPEQLPTAQGWKKSADANYDQKHADVVLAAKALEQSKSKAAAAASPAATATKTPASHDPPKVPGAVLYKIVEDARTGGIRLERVSWQLFSMDGRQIGSGRQLRHETSGKPDEKKPDPKTDPKTSDATNKKPTGEASTKINPDKSRTTTVTFTPRKKITALDVGGCGIEYGPDNDRQTPPPATMAKIHQADAYSVAIDWFDANTVPPGLYDIGLRVGFENKATTLVLVKRVLLGS